MSKQRQWVVPKPIHVDNALFGVCVSLLIIGYAMVTSSTLHLGSSGDHGFLHYPGLQMVHIGLGLIFGGVVSCVPMHRWQEWGPWLLIVGFVLLVLVLVPGVGVMIKGSRRWLSVFGIRLQVSEAFKFATVVYVAGYITRKRINLRTSVFGMMPPLVLLALASVLLNKEPDLGSAVVIIVIAMGMMFIAGARLVSFTALFAVVAGVGVLLAYSMDYRWRRVVSFRNPWADAEDTGFQLVQALISFGRGGWTGVGLGSGVQKLSYLPEAHTDFLFSVIGEELGLFGVITVIVLFGLLIGRSFQLAMMAEQADQLFSAYVAYGLSIWLGFQTFVNMGVNMGILPTKGLTLPLMSYGGSSMIIMCCAVGLLFRIHHEIVEMNARSPKGRMK